MAQVAIPLAITAFSVAGQVKSGKDAKKAADSEARQIDANAGRAREEGRSAAAEERRRTARDLSDAQAIQGGSGFSASDAQALQQIGEIAGAGKFNELSIMYEAEQNAQGLQREARNTRKSGSRARDNAYIGAAATAISGAAGIKSGYQDYSKARRFANAPTGGPLRTGYNPTGNSNPFNVGITPPFRMRGVR